VDGGCIHVKLAASAFAAQPGGYAGYSPRLLVQIIGLTATSGTAMADAPFFEGTVDLSSIGTGALGATLAFTGQLPQFHILRVTNQTNAAVATNKLDLYLDYVTE
jgi:hypothetical protein